jgi:hypothetical protein
MSSLTRKDSVIVARVAMRILRNWHVPDGDACTILGVDRARYNRWKSGRFGRIPTPIAPRLTLLIRIHLRLRLMFTDPTRGPAWMSRPNDTFAGSTPIALIANGEMESLLRLQDYLEAQSQPW